MTGGSLGPSYYEPAVTLSTDQQPRYARLPDNAKQTLVKDTVYLTDPAFVLPTRSQVRRRAFQNLQNRYYRQILYGCTNTHCETPTCLSRQKRVSKGPFRPYTVLSARTLATFLASEDHPEKGLCPYQPVNSLAVSAPEKTRKDAKLAQKVKGRSENPPRSPPITTVKHFGPSGDTKSRVSISSTTRVENGHIESASPEQRQMKSEATVKSCKNLRADDQSHKGKDPKSFAQCLFDTAAMKCLQLAELPDGYLSWLRWITRVRRNTSYYEDDNLNATVVDYQSRGDTNKPATQGLENSEVLLSPSKNQRGTVSVSTLEQANVHVDPVLPSPASSDDAKTKLSSPDPELNTVQGKDFCSSRDGLLGSCTHLENPVHGDALQAKDNMAAARKMKAEPYFQHTTKNPLQTMKNKNEHVADLRPQTLSHFTADNIQALEDTMVQNHADLYEAHRRLRMRGRTDTPLRFSTCSREEAESYRNFLAYSAQSMTYVLSNTEALMRSFVHCEIDEISSKIVRSYALPLMVRCFLQLKVLSFHPSSLFSSLWISAGYLYPDRTFHKAISAAKFRDLSPRCDVAACHIAKIIFAALVASVPECHGRTWSALSKLRAAGQVAPATDDTIVNQKLVRTVLSTGAVFENEMALSVVTKLVRGIAARLFVIKCDEAIKGYNSHYISYLVQYMISESFTMLVADEEALLPSIEAGKIIMKDNFRASESLERHFKVIIEWLRSVIMKEWDGKPEVRKNGAVSCALELLLYIQKYCFWFDGEPEIFYTPFLSERLDVMEMPPGWLDFDAAGASTHLLAYPFLFPPSVLVTYFRAINHAAMYKTFESAAMAEHMAQRMTFTDPHSGRGAVRLQDRLKVAQSNYLVLEIRRNDVLTDAMDQLWRRQRRELMRPLKVRMGMEEGEEGVDHGGVQQEFFRVAIAEAMEPKYGAFTTDPTTQMSWFQPDSLEPLYKFELLGLLTSLAVYNGLTLPFTFPLALYLKLLNLPVSKLADIEDGWPELTKGLRILRDWPEENVEDVFMRPFVFSVNVFGTTVDVDMDKARKTHFRRMEREQRWRERNYKGQGTRPRSTRVSSQKDKVEDSPSTEGSENHIAKDRKSAKASANAMGKAKQDTLSSSSDYSAGEDEPFHGHRSICPSRLSHTNPYSSDSEPIMVTNANREEYIHSYIAHLTHFTVSPQWRHFAAGFFTCINPKSLRLFTPSTLKALVEGLPEIDVKGLEHVTRYEGGYDQGHPTIRQFWRVVRSWPQEKVRKLLEFVTSSDRLPVGGVERLVFVVQKNGVGDGRLPSSSTCFGRLLLPEYDGEDDLRAGLETAVENSKGFGQP